LHFETTVYTLKVTLQHITYFKRVWHLKVASLHIDTDTVFILILLFSIR